MNVNEFFKEVGASRNKQVVCADGFSNATRYTHVEVGFPSEREPLLMQWCEEMDNPTGTVYGYVPVQAVTNVLAKHGGIVEGNVPRGVAPIPALTFS